MAPIPSFTLPFVVGSFSALALLCVVGYAIHALLFSAHSHVPGPAVCKITGLYIAYWDLKLQRNQKVYDWHQKYGPVVLIAPGQVSFSSASSTREIYCSRAQHPKSTYFDNMKMYGERPIFCTLGWEEHRDLRKRTFSFYQPSSLYSGETMKSMRERTNLFLDLVDYDISGSMATVDVLPRCNQFSFDNITGLIYGKRYAARTMRGSCQERTILDGWKLCEVYNNLLYNLPWVHWAFRAAGSYIYSDPDFLAAEESLTLWNMNRLELILRQDSQQEYDMQPPLARVLQKTKTLSGTAPSLTWIAAEVLDNIHAAQTTVALALTYALWDLACHPAWQENVRAEVQSLALQDDGLPAFADIDAVPVLDAVIQESYRVHPLSSGRAERVVPFTQSYDGTILPSGTIVSSSTLSLHRSTAIFPDPHTFDPERWLKADASQLRTMQSSFIPFGQGARVCLGKAFANAQVKMLISSMLLRYKIRTDELSNTNPKSMEQLGTQNALPRGLRCDITMQRLLAGES